jgi:hypothetical protein
VTANNVEKCPHGQQKGRCGRCLMICQHGVDHAIDGAYCEPCEDEEERRFRADCDDDDTCEKHGIDNCLQCGQEMDNLAEKAREQADWMHWHPAEDE